jgi:hypothetical protein
VRRLWWLATREAKRHDLATRLAGLGLVPRRAARPSARTPALVVSFSDTRHDLPPRPANLRMSERSGRRVPRHHHLVGGTEVIGPHAGRRPAGRSPLARWEGREAFGMVARKGGLDHRRRAERPEARQQNRALDPRGCNRRLSRPTGRAAADGD